MSQPSSIKPTHRHKRRGTEYELIGCGRMQSPHWRDPGTPADNCPHGPSVNYRDVAIYRSVDDGSLWVLPWEEFQDGRFLALDNQRVEFSRVPAEGRASDRTPGVVACPVRRPTAVRTKP